MSSLSSSSQPFYGQSSEHAVSRAPSHLQHQLNSPLRGAAWEEAFPGEAQQKLVFFFLHSILYNFAPQNKGEKYNTPFLLHSSSGKWEF